MLPYATATKGRGTTVPAAAHAETVFGDRLRRLTRMCGITFFAPSRRGDTPPLSPPWSVEDIGAAFVVKDSAGESAAHQKKHKADAARRQRANYSGYVFGATTKSPDPLESFLSGCSGTNDGSSVSDDGGFNDAGAFRDHFGRFMKRTSKLS
jgi:hypothetical protein